MASKPDGPEPLEDLLQRLTLTSTTIVTSENNLIPLGRAGYSEHPYETRLTVGVYGDPEVVYEVERRLRALLRSPGR